MKEQGKQQGSTCFQVENLEICGSSVSTNIIGRYLPLMGLITHTFIYEQVGQVPG